MTPVHPIIRLSVAKMFIEDYGLSRADAFDCAVKLIDRLKARDMDIIRGNWMARAEVLTDRTPRFDWNDVARQVEELEASGHAPWNAPELRS